MAKYMKRRSNSGCCVLAILFLLSGARLCPAQVPDLNQVASDLAEQVAAVLKDVPDGKKNTVDLTTIVGRESGGPGFRKALMDALTQRGIQLTRPAEYKIDGEVKSGDPSKQSSAAVSVNLSLRGPNLERQLSGKVAAEADVIALAGATGMLPVKVDRPMIGLAAPVPGAGQAVAVNEAERQVKLAQIVHHPDPPKVTPNPTPFIDTTGRPEMSEIHVGPFAIEILIKDPQGRIATADGTRYNPRPPVKGEHGELFVDIRPGEIYAVKLINDAKTYDTGVKLTIDGLDCFEFSEEPGYKKLGLWVIPHESSGIIRGWHMRNKNGQMVLAEFEVAKYGEGLAEEMGITGDVGKITASFRAAWDPSGSTPGSMLAYSSVRGTKKGEEVAENLSEMRRHFGEIRAAITIRYQVAPAK